MSKEEKLRCIHGRTEKQACRKCREEDEEIRSSLIPSLPAIVKALEKERARFCSSSPSPSTAAHTAGYVEGLEKAIGIVKEHE